MINLAVLFGGMSTEHEISIISAIQAMENMDKEKYNILPIYIAKNGDFYFEKNLFLDSNNFKDIPKLLNASKKITFVKNGNKVYIKNADDRFFGKINIEVDIAFPIVHGTNVEDGNLQGYIHTLGIPLVGCNTLASGIGMDKYVMKKFLESENVPVIKGIRLDINDYKNIDSAIKKCEDNVPYPMIVKPVDLGSSIGISKAKDRDALKEALELAFTFANIVVVEKAIVNMKEINCSVVGDRYEAEASVLEEPFGNDEILSYKDKYMSGGSGSKGNGSKGSIGCKGSAKISGGGIGNKMSGSKISGSKMGGTKGGMASLQRKVPAELDEKMTNEIKDLAVKTFKVIGCSGVSRIDFIIDKDENKAYVNEINTIPGSLSFYLWEPTGLKYKDLLDKLIEIALREKRREEKLEFTFDENIFGK